MTIELGATTARPALRLARWRDNDPEVLDEPGIALDEVAAAGDPAELAAEWYAEGVRRVGLDRPVDLTGGMDQHTLVWSMVLLRELTGRGIAVDWTLRLGEHTDLWSRFNHLYPPAALECAATDAAQDAAELLQEWRETFYVGKCVFRRGPGFIEVRDHRAGSLSRFVIDDEDYLTALESLLGGVPAAEVDAEVLAALSEEGLAGVVGDLAWWLPYRIRRWPWPAMSV